MSPFEPNPYKRLSYLKLDFVSFRIFVWWLLSVSFYLHTCVAVLIMSGFFQISQISSELVTKRQILIYSWNCIVCKIPNILSYNALYDLTFRENPKGLPKIGNIKHKTKTDEKHNSENYIVEKDGPHKKNGRRLQLTANGRSFLLLARHKASCPYSQVH